MRWNPIPRTSSNAGNSQSTQFEKNFHIIVGSFSEKNNAQVLIKQLKKRGFQNTKIIGQNERGLTRVAVASFYTQEEAKKKSMARPIL